MSKEWRKEPSKTLPNRLGRALSLAVSWLRYPADSPAETVGNEPIRIEGLVQYRLYGPDGTLKQEKWVKNLITTVGFQAVAECVGKSASRPAVFDYIAIGTGTTGAALGNTTLETEIARVQGTYSYDAGNKRWSIVSTFSPGTGTGAITESGCLNASSSGTLLNRQTFSVISKGAADTLEVTWRFTLT